MDDNLLKDDDNIRLISGTNEKNKRAIEVIEAGIKNLNEHFIQQCATELGISREEVEAIISSLQEKGKNSEIMKDNENVNTI